MPSRIADVVTGLLVICALVVTGFVIHRWYEQPSSSSEPQTQTVSNPGEIAEAGIQVGASGGAVTVTVFTDYQCPYCRELNETLTTLQRRYSERLTLSYRHRPLPGHEHARAAAMAAVCASMRGTFETYHSLLFANSGNLNTTVLDSLAREAGIDSVSDFRSCRRSEKARRLVRRDIREARSAGVTSVPTMIVGNQLLSGAQPTSVVDSLIQRQLGDG